MPSVQPRPHRVSRPSPTLLTALFLLVLVALARDAAAQDRDAFAASPLPVAAHEAARRCVLGERSDNPAGLYATDPFPKGQVVLTFDDGPHPAHTSRVLDLLAKHRMPATFFLIGRNIDAKTYPLVQRMVRDGHTLATHSYSHDVTMASGKHHARTVEYVHAQHETTQVLLDLALMARSAEDFDAMFVRVFGGRHRHLSGRELRGGWRSFVQRHAQLVEERSPGRRPHQTLFSRPPGGNPFVGGSEPGQKRNYGAALGRLGLLNVMWHGESGDTHPELSNDADFLSENLRRTAKRGGVMLVHDYIRKDVLAAALAAIGKDPTLRVVPIERAVEVKFGCGTADLRRALAPGAA
jgi:hypothetical protein